MEELVPIQYGSFTILGRQAKEYAHRIGCSTWVADQTLQGQLYLSELRWEHLGWNTIQKQEWGLFLWEHLLHNAASMRRKKCQWCSWKLQAEMAKVMAPEYPSFWTLLGSMDVDILKITEKDSWGNYVTAPSVPLWWQQEECIKELCQELAQCTARAGLQSRPRSARPTSLIMGCSHRWAQSPLA